MKLSGLHSGFKISDSGDVQQAPDINVILVQNLHAKRTTTPSAHTAYLKTLSWGAWVAQWVECPTLDFGSGHYPWVLGSSPTSGSVLSVEPAWHSLSFSPSVPLPCSCACTLSQIKQKKNPKKQYLDKCLRLTWILLSDTFIQSAWKNQLKELHSIFVYSQKNVPLSEWLVFSLSMSLSMLQLNNIPMVHFWNYFSKERERLI